MTTMKTSLKAPKEGLESTTNLENIKEAKEVRI